LKKGFHDIPLNICLFIIFQVLFARVCPLVAQVLQQPTMQQRAQFNSWKPGPSAINSPRNASIKCLIASP